MIQYWINAQKRRYYHVHMHLDILGDLTLTRCWGSLDSRRGRIQNEVVTNLKQGRKILDEIGIQRIRRGYKLTDRH